MKTIALLSGGKDSILAVLMAYRYGHEPAVVVNIVPALPGGAGTTASEAATAGHDIDSYMYQTVGFEAVDAIAACLQVPLRRACVKRGRAKDQSLLYSETPPDEDEVESLFQLLKEVKAEFPEVQGLTSGAILSNYQRNRVECICDRLGIESLAYLWMRQPSEILDMAHELSVRAILVKTASIGLVPRKLIGKTLEEARPTLEKMTELYQSHLAGEGGEYETTVLNCPLFAKEQLEVTSLEVVMQDDNDISPSGHGVLTVRRVAKPAKQQTSETALLHRLRGGEFHFPSDVLPLLQALSSSRARALASAEKSGEATCGLSAAASASFSLLSGAPRPGGVEGRAVRRSVSRDPSTKVAADTAARAAVQACVDEVQAWATTHRVSPFYYHFSLPNSAWEGASRAVYTAKVSHVCPPGLLVTVRSTGEEATSTSADEIVVEVLTAPSDAIQRNVLHAQSRSCWALGEPGPYAECRRVGFASGDALIFVSATAGRVPATRDVATVQDLPEACRQRLLDFLTSSNASCAAAAAAAAEFLFAMANCERYLALYRHALHNVTRATIFVTQDVAPSLLQLLPLLWRWCTGTTSAAADFVQVCTVVPVASLSAGEHVRVMLEAAEACEA